MSNAFTRSTLVNDGYTLGRIDHAVKCGRFERLHDGIYIDPALDQEQQWRARLHGHIIRGGAGSAASHRSAARLHGMDGTDERHIDVTVAHHASFRGPPAIRSRHVRLDDTLVHGIPVTSRAQTLLDLGRFIDPDALELALESALRGDDRMRPETWHEPLLRELIGRLSAPARTRGAGMLRRVVARRPPGARPTGSFAETKALQALRAVGLGDVVRQPRVDVALGNRAVHTYYPDFAIASHGLLIEIDGREGHTGDRATQRDLPRQNLLLTGFELLRFSAAAVLGNPATFAGDVVSAIDHLPRRATEWYQRDRRIVRTGDDGWWIAEASARRPTG